jgi:hypothetical protein
MHVVKKVPLYISSETFLVGIIVQHILNIILHIIIPSLHDCQSTWGVNCCDFRIFFLTSYHVVSNYTIAEKEKGCILWGIVSEYTVETGEIDEKVF